ncbi:sorting nexin-4-like isoform X2 [Acanthaster planci]|uniref:Sorting nexin-4-like isoform X2 n=1 Tax=Acanthaster planci TaxID=133434 RepID=A0A8B7Z2L3_ACAPL|nr:sorting nexin-4-like isoform X2 [Acanthaster planci]
MADARGDVSAPNYDSDLLSSQQDASGQTSIGNLAKIAAQNRKPKLPHWTSLIDCQDGSLLEQVEICVTEQEKRTGAGTMGMKDVFTVYLVETRVKESGGQGLGDGHTSLWRRYSEFELLRNYLVVTYSYVIVPPLPEKRMTLMWQQLSTVDNFDADFIERRRVGLEGFLQRVGAHQTLCQDSIFHGFLKQEDGWKEAVHSTGFQAKQDSRLKSLNASFRLKKPDRKFEDLKNYASELQANITAVLKVRAKLVDRLYGIHKIHGNYGRVFSEWSGIEQEMGDGLQSAGHFMDAYKDYIDDYMNEEEQIADQLKEYIYFADALKSVCRKQEVLQYEMEKASDLLTAKKLQRDQVLGNAPSKSFSFRGMRSKIFGPESQESKDAQIKVLEEQIEECEQHLKQATQETERFIESASAEVERFKKQRTTDLKEIFINYAILQIKISKRGIAVWTNMKDCFQKM